MSSQFNFTRKSSILMLVLCITLLISSLSLVPAYAAAEVPKERNYSGIQADTAIVPQAEPVSSVPRERNYPGPKSASYVPGAGNDRHEAVNITPVSQSSHSVEDVTPEGTAHQAVSVDGDVSSGLPAQIQGTGSRRIES